MAPNKFIRNCVLLPMSKIYGIGVATRNAMFSMGILKKRKFDIPVVVVGNIAAGGTGKTPHTEYVVNLLKYNYHIGVLSRGYKRATKGFVLATNRSTPLDIGDEPYQIYRKFGREVTVAVCENRCEGIDELRKIDPNINLIVLDDAFQHRYVEPAISIVLTEFNRPVFQDKLLPLGRLREKMTALHRADMVIVTKCPEELRPLEYRIFHSKLDLFPYQQLYFSRYSYTELRAVFPEEVRTVPSLTWLNEDSTLLVISGMANPRPLVRFLKGFKAKVRVKVFPDHHNFSRKDLEAIVARFEELPGDEKYIITSEKDAVRLSNNPYFPHQLKNRIFYQPITVVMDDKSSESFDFDLKKKISDFTLYKS